MSVERIVWLTGMPRSGTNWMSQVLASHPDVRLKFCPLFSYRFKNACDEHSSAEDWQQLFQSVYSTQDEYLDQDYLRRDGLVSTFEEKADEPPVLAIKSTRYHNLTEGLLEKVPNLKVVALVRNPAAAIASWLNNALEFPDGADPDTEWRTGACRKGSVGEFWGFDDWKAVTRQHVALARAAPDRVRLLVYEKAVKDPEAELAALFEWAGLSFADQTRTFVAESQNRHVDHPRAVFKTAAGSTSWQNRLDPHIRWTIGREVAGTALARFADTETVARGAGYRGSHNPVKTSGPVVGLASLAAFGGTPLFPKASVRPIGQLATPEAAVFGTAIDRIYQQHRLSNNGPNAVELEVQLAQRHNTAHAIVFASASLAIIPALAALGRVERGEVLVPAFTYVGLPHLIRWAGHDPVFCDVDPVRHTLDPERARSLVTARTAAILAVHQVNAPCDIAAFDRLTADTGVPVLYDSVHALGCTLADGTPTGASGAAEVFSLHATKVLNGFEGGYVTTEDPVLAQELRELRNFGYISETRTSRSGLNGKLNEVHAAAALASLAELDDIFARNKARYECYREAFAGIPGLSFVPYGPGYRERNYEFALLALDPHDWPLDRDTTVALLRAENALARAYYNEPLYVHDDYPAPGSHHIGPNLPGSTTMPVMPVTDRLARQIIQMPVGELVSHDDVRKIAAWFRAVFGLAPEIKAGQATAEPVR